MATIPVESTAAAGTKITASWANSNVVDAVNFLLAAGGNPRPFASVYRSAALSPANATFTLISFDAEVEDNDYMHDNSTNPSRVTLWNDGIWQVTYGIAFASSATGRRIGQVRSNAGGLSGGGTFQQQFNVATSPSGTFAHQGIFAARFIAGDYLELFVEQQSGGALAIQTGAGFNFLSAMWLSS